jgi:hypothetical protein
LAFDKGDIEDKKRPSCAYPSSLSERTKEEAEKRLSCGHESWQHGQEEQNATVLQADKAEKRMQGTHGLVSSCLMPEIRYGSA